MVETTYVIGVDVGTQSLKVGIFTVDGTKIWSGSSAYSTHYPSPGLCEQNPNDWWEAFLHVMRNCALEVDLQCVEAISVCATSSTVLIASEEGEALTPAILWMDTRAIQEVEKINHHPDPHIQKILRFAGEKVSAEWMTPKSLWFKNNRTLIAGHKIVEQLDWFNYRLTRNWTSSLCNTTCKWNYVGEEGFSEEFFQAIGFEEYKDVWPLDVKAVGEQVGTLIKEVASATGLKEGIPVFQGGIDAHIGMLGVGATDPGEMSLIMGTSFVHLVHTEEAVFEPGLWGPYQNAILPDSWLLEGGQLTCGSLTTWFMEQFYHGVEKEQYPSVYEDLYKNIRKLPPGSNGLIILDSWQGNRTPYRNPSAKGNIFGLTLAHTRYDIFRAILESVAYGTKNIIELFQKAMVPINRIIASGGGTRNAIWMQIISDVTGLAIDIAEETEAGTKGCAVICSFGLGNYPSLAEASKSMTTTVGSYRCSEDANKQYEAAFERYISLYEKLLPHM
ncbi:FGGY-family carbohydrate kinase [Pseudoneobacillus sp. C159]